MNSIIDYYAEDRQRWIAEQQTRGQKLADAIAYLRERGKYCLDLNSKFRYLPAKLYPMEPK